MAARQRRELRIASMRVPTRMHCVTLSGRESSLKRSWRLTKAKSITNWAKREAKYRRQKTASDTRSTRAGGQALNEVGMAEGELPVRRPSERRYPMLQKWAKNGVFLVEPKDNGRTLVVTVTELASLTVDEAKRRPEKVRAAIQKTLDKAVQKAAEKPPTRPLVRRRVFDAGRSIPSGAHRKIHSKPVGGVPLETLAVTEKIGKSQPMIIANDLRREVKKWFGSLEP